MGVFNIVCLIVQQEDFNKAEFNYWAWKVVMDAEKLAETNPPVKEHHFLKALLDEPPGFTRQIFLKAGAKFSDLKSIDQFIGGLCEVIFIGHEF